MLSNLLPAQLAEADVEDQKPLEPPDMDQESLWRRRTSTIGLWPEGEMFRQHCYLANLLTL